MFEGAFQNGIKVVHFNESLSQKSAFLLTDVVIRAKCYLKGNESNAEKKVHNVKEHVLNAEGSHHPKKDQLYLVLKGQECVQEGR